MEPCYQAMQKPEPMEILTLFLSRWNHQAAKSTSATILKCAPISAYSGFCMVAKLKSMLSHA